jgi:hypothetical protein
MKCRITTGQLLFEKKVVEMPVEQSPVHVEQDIVDLAPVDDVRGKGSLDVARDGELVEP